MEVEVMRLFGSMRKKTRILRMPGVVGSVRVKLSTLCCSMLGQHKDRPCIHVTEPMCNNTGVYICIH